MGKLTPLKEKFKKDVLSRKIEKDKDIVSQQKKLEAKGRRLQLDMDRTLDNISLIQTDLLQNRKEETVAKWVLKNLNLEFETLESEYQKTVQSIQELDSEKEWLDWLDKWGQKVELQTATDESKKDFIRKIIKKIIVRSEYGRSRDGKDIQVGHSFDIHFNLKVVKDKLVYKDTNKKSLGYDIKLGKSQLNTGTLNTGSGRGRKKKVQSQFTVRNKLATVE